MTNTRHLPAALSAVSSFFLVGGILCAIDMLGGALMGSFHFHFGILGIPVFLGVRQLSPGWRTCALVLIWISLIIMPIAFIFGFVGLGPAFIRIFGQHLANFPRIWFSVIAAVFFSLNLWMYRVLTRPHIRGMFFTSPQTPAA